jgi:hypothetical protein
MFKKMRLIVPTKNMSIKISSKVYDAFSELSKGNSINYLILEYDDKENEFLFSSASAFGDSNLFFIKDSNDKIYYIIFKVSIIEKSSKNLNFVLITYGDGDVQGFKKIKLEDFIK